MVERVYIIENPGMPGLIKVGITKRFSEDRAAELDGTGLPYAHEVSHEVILDTGSRYVESETHKALAEYRTRANREWFRCEKEHALSVIYGVIECSDSINLLDEVDLSGAKERAQELLDQRNREEKHAKERAEREEANVVEHGLIVLGEIYQKHQLKREETYQSERSNVLWITGATVVGVLIFWDAQPEHRFWIGLAATVAGFYLFGRWDEVKKGRGSQPNFTFSQNQLIEMISSKYPRNEIENVAVKRYVDFQSEQELKKSSGRRNKIEEAAEGAGKNAGDSFSSYS